MNPKRTAGDEPAPGGPPAKKQNRSPDKSTNSRHKSVPLMRRAGSLHDEVARRRRRLQSAPLPQPGEDNTLFDRRAFLQQARATEEWQPLHLDASDDSFDWPILLLQPGPDIVTPGTPLEWLYVHRNDFPRQFARWCKRHLDPTARDYAGLGALNSLATAAQGCYYAVRTDARWVYDWNKDELLLRPPTFRLTGLHRLHYQIAHEPRELQDYFHRQLDRYAVTGPDLQMRVNQLRAAYILHGHDGRINWSLMADYYPTTNPATIVTRNFPLQGIDGHWTVRQHQQTCLLTTAELLLT